MEPMMRYTLLFLTCLFGQATPNKHSAYPPEYNMFGGALYATCRMAPNTKLTPGMPKVYGQVLFKQNSPQEKLEVTFRLHGLPPSTTQSRAIHIHQYGDLSEGCTSTGGHYNPEEVDHPNHVGDFGNFKAPNGKIRTSVKSIATLYGGESVYGRAVVIHAEEDDMGKGGNAESLLHGNSGERLACCVIGISTPAQWEKC